MASDSQIILWMPKPKNKEAIKLGSSTDQHARFAVRCLKNTKLYIQTGLPHRPETFWIQFVRTFLQLTFDYGFGGAQQIRPNPTTRHVSNTHFIVLPSRYLKLKWCSSHALMTFRPSSTHFSIPHFNSPTPSDTLSFLPSAQFSAHKCLWIPPTQTRRKKIVLRKTFAFRKRNTLTTRHQCEKLCACNFSTTLITTTTIYVCLKRISSNSPRVSLCSSFFWFVKRWRRRRCHLRLNLNNFTAFLVAPTRTYIGVAFPKVLEAHSLGDQKPSIFRVAPANTS